MNWITFLSEYQNCYMRMMDHLSDENLIELYNDFEQPDYHISAKRNAIIRQFAKRGFDMSDISNEPCSSSLHPVSMNHKVKLIEKKILSLNISQN